MPRVHDDEVDIDEGLVRALLVEQFPEWADLPLERAGDGTVNVIYRLGDDLSVRLPRRGGEWSDQEREAAILLAVGGRLPVDVPEVRGLGRPSARYPFAFAIHSWLDGDLPREPVGADELAAVIGALQRLETKGAPARAGGRSRPLRERDAAVRDALTRFAPPPGAIGLWEAGRDAPEWDGPELWGHCDLDARNVLVREGRLAAVLDWSGAGLGDPAVDVMAAWKLLAPDERDRFRDLLSVDDATWLRAQAWLVSQAMLALAYYTIETEPTLVREAHKWLAAVLDG